MYKKRILIDVGSSTVKVYKFNNKKLSLLFARSIPFKKGFDPNVGITEENKKELFELLHEVKKRHQDFAIKLYATALYRKMTKEALRTFVDETFMSTGLFFNVVPHELECFYLEVALVGKYTRDKPVLLVNIGGGSTELVVMYGKEAVEKHNLDIGVGTILTKFEGINESVSTIPLKEIIDYVKKSLPPLQNKTEVAFYSGGELKYMQLAGYPIEKNTLFNDENHPSMIKLAGFSSKNKAVFDSIKLNELEELMPENPKWMHGARACSALSQAIFDAYEIKKIVPSDANLIDGVVRQEFRYVTLSGSFRKHLEYIINIRNALVSGGVQVLSPRFTEPKNPGEEFVVFAGEEGLTTLELERHHLESIEKSDALIVCDPKGYVGASALSEIGYAQALGKRIIFTEKPDEFMLNTLPSEVGL